MIVRQAKLADEDGVCACAEDAYKQYVDVIGKKPAPMVSDFRHLISESLVHVAVNKHGEVDGFIVFFPRDDHMFLENVAVKGSAVGKGIGGRLMMLCEGEASRLGLECIQLYTNEKMTENLTIYPHWGYRETGRRKEDGFSRVYFEKKLG